MAVLLVFSHLRWDTMFQRPQQLFVRLARRHRVLFVEEPVPADEVRLERVEPCEGVAVLRLHSPLGQPGFHDDQLRLLRPLLQRAVREEAGRDELIAWFCTPAPLPLLASLEPRLVIYDCIDTFASPRLRRREPAMLGTAHLVFTSGPGLYEARRALHPNVHLLPSAVDATPFAPERITARQAEYLAAERLQSGIGTPRLGYFGVIDERFDGALIAAVADARPDWHLVMVGPLAVDPASLPQRDNIHWLGHQPYLRLPALVAGWDVCLLPLLRAGHSRFIGAAHTLEYLAAEKPVVASGLPDVVSICRRVVRIGADAPSFVAACADALAETPEQRSERLALSAACIEAMSWDDTAQAVLSLIDGALASELPRPPARRAGRPQTVETAVPTP